MMSRTPFAVKACFEEIGGGADDVSIGDGGRMGGALLKKPEHRSGGPTDPIQLSHHKIELFSYLGSVGDRFF